MNEPTSAQPSDFSPPSRRVLVLAPDGSLAAAIRAALFEAAPQANVNIAHSLEEAQHVMVHQHPDLFVLDLDANYDLGQEFLDDLRTSHPNARAIVLTAVHLAAHRERAAGLGAIHFLEKPFPHDDFVTLAGALLQPNGPSAGEKFQGTTSVLDPAQHRNVIGSLYEPFTSELLLSTVDTFMPNDTPGTTPASVPPAAENEWTPVEDENLVSEPVDEKAMDDDTFEGSDTPLPASEVQSIEAAVGGENDAWWNAAPSFESASDPEPGAIDFNAPAESIVAPVAHEEIDIPIEQGGTFFSGDTRFFSLNWALHTISTQKLTGTLRAFWNHDPVELLAREGQLILASTRDPELYCPEGPITLVNIEEERTGAARAQQRETGRPLFITLAEEGLILREPAVQLVQHYGQKLFAQLWTARRVRIMFEQSESLPHFAESIPGEEDVDHWALSSLRFIQFQELGTQADYDPASVPAYTRDGFARVQQLRLTVAEAQFASQFNGVRSIAQIAKNLRLDLKFARFTLFRFLALEIVECWPPAAAGAKPDKRGVFGRLFRE
ncbi:MAG: response regulator [Chthoniobacterales bacterium]